LKSSIGRIAGGAGALVLGALLVFGVLEFAGSAKEPVVEVYHCPELFARRFGDVTANVTGEVSRFSRGVRYRVNGGDWVELRHSRSRIPAPLFTIEIAPDQLRVGSNTLEITGKRFGIWEQTRDCEFDYDSSGVVLPFIEDWTDTDLDVQDGYWETLEKEGEHRVRPVPRHEGYDRLLLVTGAFAGARRVETTIILRNHAVDKPYGFGVLPLWGGRPDRDGILPRRGWNFSLVWFYSHYGGVGQEFSYKDSSALPDWASNYRSIHLQEDVPYRVVVEAGPVRHADGSHWCYYQRMKWWVEGEPEPEEWMELTDIVGSPLPPGEFSVALVAHRSQVEYGPVRVLPVEAQWAQNRMEGEFGR
jgi:hypothetical protein